MAAEQQYNTENSNTATTAAAAFPRFPDLPPELRLQIWRHALEAPRLVDVRFGQVRGRRTPHWHCCADSGDGWRLEHAPALCFVNRESRGVARAYVGYSFLVVEGVRPARHRLRFALTGDDVVALGGDAVLRVNPSCTFAVTSAAAAAAAAAADGGGDNGGGGDGQDSACGDKALGWVKGAREHGVRGARGVRRVLIQQPLDALFDILGSGPWYPSGWPHTDAMKRAVARETFSRLRSAFGEEDGGAGEGLQTVYCLEDGWVSTSMGPRSLHGVPGEVASVWNYEPVFARMVKVYDKSTDGKRGDDEKAGNRGGEEARR